MESELQAVRKRKTSGFFTILTYAACEWFLMLLLFVRAIFSYMLRKFAHYCELEAPCPLCSMLDHVFGEKKSGSYWSLVCSFHKEEVSSIVSYFALGNLADVHGICERCLMSNSQSHKLLVGISWEDFDLNKHFKPGCSGSRTCLCCKKMCRAKSNGERSLELNNFELGSSRANSKPPLPRVPSQRHLRHGGSWKGLRAPKSTKQIGNNSVGTSLCVGYSKPNLSSDSESESPLSKDDDDDDGSVVSSSGNNYMKPEHAIGFRRRDLSLVDSVVLNERKNACPSPIDGMNEHCLRELSSAKSGSNLAITEKSIDNGGPCEHVAGTSSNDACLSNSDSKIDSLSQISESMELPCDHELEPLNASDSAKSEQDMKPRVLASTSEVCSLLKRNDSSYESLDGISVDDIENESIVDRLKRQVEHDRSCIKSLLKEVEEERNAAAVAANETMAMITRLQDEKATLRMEALQYLRMVEETAHDLISQREKELEDMEYELEYYRNNQSGLDELGLETTSVLEKEKLGISQCLKELEKKVCIAHCGRNADEMANGLNWKNKNRASNGSPKVVGYQVEIAALGDRLEAFEADWNLLKCASNLLQCGTEGLQFIRDLARLLHELRKMGYRERRCGGSHLPVAT